MEGAQRKGCKQKCNHVYRQDLHENLRILRQQICSGEIEVGNYNYFYIYDPKERRICAASFPERVLHHAIMNICHPHFEKYQIYHSYASRIGKGTYAALVQAQVFTKRYRYYLKLDFKKHFDSIDHAMLKKQLRKMYKDYQLLHIFDAIINSYTVQPEKGVPIGNLTSQYFANHYIAVADHFALEQLGVSAYVRYMDDIVIWDNDKDRLLAIGRQFQQFTQEQLTLTLKPFCLNQNTYGLPFLGYIVYPDTIGLALRSRRRFRQKLKSYYTKLENGLWSQEDFQRHVRPLIAYTEHAHSRGFRKNVLATLEYG